MDDFEDIKAKVERMSPEQEAKLRAWLNERDHAAWDKQIVEDFASGRLNSLIAEAKADIAAGRERDL
jgi:phage shock protein A